jgi:hypothetical protein
MSSGTATHHVHSSRLVSLVLWMAVLTAQQTRAVRGTVKDQEGHVLTGAVVQIQNMTSLNIRSLHHTERWNLLIRKAEPKR